MNSTTNAHTIIEKMLAVKVATLLSANSFPDDRISVQILFKDAMKIPSDSKISLEEGVSPITGTVKILFSSLLVSQDSALFLSYVSVHEVAHVFNDLSAINQDTSFKKHGPEWQDWLYNLSDDPLVEPKIDSELFDTRACVSRGGGCIAVCDCPDPEYLAFGVRSDEFRLCSEGELDCAVCEAPYRIIPPGEVGGSLGDSIKYLHLVSGFRSMKDIDDLMSPVKPY